MKKTITISKYFFNKNLKDIISFSVILLIATILFSSAIVLNNNISKDYDTLFDNLNTASAFFTIPDTEYSSDLLNSIKNIRGISEVEARKGIMMNVPVNMDRSTQEQNQIFYNIEDETNINQYKIISYTKDKIDYGIYLSNYTASHAGLDIKDKYEFKVDNVSYTFNIKGIINEMQYGNYTSSVIGQYLDQDSYNYLLHKSSEKEVVTISVKSDNANKTYNNVSKYLSSKNINVLNKNYKEQAKNGRLAISNILVMILMLFSSVMLIISLFVSKFKIEETIEEEMANMGALKALGYTSNEIIASCIFPYIMSGLILTILGIVTSYTILPVLSKVIEMQSGFIWKVSIDLLSNLFVLFINLILIVVFTLMASSKIKKLNPINAIRGLTEKSNNENYFEIERTKGNIHFILILKNFIHTRKQNILLGIVLFFITILSSFIGILFYNINMNPLNFINTLVEEHPDLVVTTTEYLKEEIGKLNNVKNVLYYDESVTVNFKNNSYKTFVAESFDNLANNLCYDGSDPRNSNEIAVGSKIKEDYGINIGDYITIGKNGIENKYKVVGFVQSVNYSGEVMELTLEGYKRLDSLYTPKIMYVYLNNERDSTAFIKTLESKYGNAISTMNYAESMDSAISMYVSLISIICIVIIVITLLLIYLILYMLISSVISKRKQELGIFKAIGYENKQLVRQLVGGFLPSTIASSILGLIVSKIFMSNIYTSIFKAVGAYKVSFEYPIIVFLIVVLLLIFTTFMIGIILARKIKKISVYSLIKD